MRIAIAACAKNPELSKSNDRFRQSLSARGAEVMTLNWNGHPMEEFLRCDLTVLRQTWDYQEDPGGFAAWLVRLHAVGGRVEARPDLAVWNNDKRTLMELARAGVYVPATVPLALDPSSESLKTIPSKKVVLKPAFGGDGFGVAVAERADFSETLKRVRGEFPGRPFMAQEFLPEIAEGEWKMTCIEGKVAVTVHAKPCEGEFRINSRFGPTVEVKDPPKAARTAAERIMSYVGTPLCARVDGVMRGDRFICTELELCDPDLHLHYAPEVADQLAEATLRRA